MESRPAAGQILEVCEELSSEIVDARLDAILFLGGHADRAACLVAANTDLRDAKLFEGASPQQQPDDIFELLASGSANSRASSRGSIQERMAYVSEEIEAPGGLGRGTAELRKLGAIADSDDPAQGYRHDHAHRSDLIPRGIPI